MGHPAAGKELAASGLAAPIAQGWIGAQQGHLQHLRELLFQLGHHVAGDEAPPRPQHVLDARQQGWPLEQFFRERAVGRIVSIKEMQAPAGMGSGHPRQELQHRIHHQIGQQLAGDINGPNPGIAQANQGEELALLVVVGPRHEGHLGGIHGERRHHEQIEIRPVAVVLPAPFRAQLLLEFAETQGHRDGAAKGRHGLPLASVTHRPGATSSRNSQASEWPSFRMAKLQNGNRLMLWNRWPRACALPCLP